MIGRWLGVFKSRNTSTGGIGGIQAVAATQQAGYLWSLMKEDHVPFPRYSIALLALSWEAYLEPSFLHDALPCSPISSLAATVHFPQLLTLPGYHRSSLRSRISLFAATTHAFLSSSPQHSIGIVEKQCRSKKSTLVKLLVAYSIDAPWSNAKSNILNSRHDPCEQAAANSNTVTHCRRETNCTTSAQISMLQIDRPALPAPQSPDSSTRCSNRSRSYRMPP